MQKMFLKKVEKRSRKKKQENIKPKSLLFYFGLFVDIFISNFSQKIKKIQNNHSLLGYLKPSHEKCWLSAH